jgi:hypothetical protein
MRNKSILYLLILITSGIYANESFNNGVFSIGKTLAINTVTSLGSGLFSGASAAGTSLTASSTIASKTATAGLQTVTTTFATSAISGITYNNGNFGYDKNVLKSGIDNMWSNALVSMATSGTTSSLTSVNSGFKLEKLEGFDKVNKTDLAKFNGLVGSLAGRKLCNRE